MTSTIPWLNKTPAGHFHAVRDTSLSKLVRDDMLEQILKGVLTPGQRINEPDVASRLQVSRVPVREALRELESSGLVVSRKNSGVFVRELDATEIRDLYQMRGLLDGFAGRLVARLPDAARMQLVERLEQSIATMRAVADGNELQSYYAENLRFHWIIVEAAGNQQLSETYRGVVQKLHLSRLKNLAQDMGVQVSIAEHVRIVQALRGPDPGACEDLMARHVGDAYDRLIDNTRTKETP